MAVSLPLVFDAPRRGMPPRHLADLSLEDRVAAEFLPEDRVVVELSPYDLTRGRIVFRYR